MGEKESGPFRARLSNLSYYAATGVKARVFVPILFSKLPEHRNNLNIISSLWGRRARSRRGLTQFGLIEVIQDLLTAIVFLESV